MSNPQTTKFKSPQSFKVGHKSGVGRPRVDDGLPLPPRINISFTQEQQQWLVEQSEIRNCSLSNVIRECIDKDMVRK